MELVEAYENDMIDYEEGNIDNRKAIVEVVSLAADVNVNAAMNAGVASDNDDDDDGDINFFDDDMSDD